MDGAENDPKAEAEEDPMRVRGSFYMAKNGAGGFGALAGLSKSPREKRAGGTRIASFPKKKAKLRLEPLKPRKEFAPTLGDDDPNYANNVRKYFFVSNQSACR